MNEASSEPVADSAKLVAAIVGLVGGILTVLVTIGLVSAGDVPGLVAAAASIATALVTLLGVVMPLLQARGVRALVTPLTAPRNQDGVPLVPLPTA